MKKTIIVLSVLLVFLLVINSKSDYIPAPLPVPATQPKSDKQIIEKLQKELFDLQVDLLILQVRLKALYDHVRESPDLPDKPKEILI